MTWSSQWDSQQWQQEKGRNWHSKRWSTGKGRLYCWDEAFPELQNLTGSNEQVLYVRRMMYGPVVPHHCPAASLWMRVSWTFSLDACPFFKVSTVHAFLPHSKNEISSSFSSLRKRGTLLSPHLVENKFAFREIEGLTEKRYLALLVGIFRSFLSLDLSLYCTFFATPLRWVPLFSREEDKEHLVLTVHRHLQDTRSIHQPRTRTSIYSENGAIHRQTMGIPHHSDTMYQVPVLLCLGLQDFDGSQQTEKPLLEYRLYIVNVSRFLSFVTLLNTSIVG